MGVEGCGKFMKYALFVANILIWIGSIVVVGIGIWALVDKSQLENFLGSGMYRSSASIMIAMGVVVMIIAFLGCFGAMREVKWMLLTYFVILLIIFIILLVGGILAYVFKDKVEKSVREKMAESAKEYGGTNKEGKAVTDAWDSAQKQFKCCGVVTTAETDSWKVFMGNTNLGLGLPKSCCMTADDCGTKTTAYTPTGHYEKGCLKGVADYFKHNSMVLGGICVAIAVIMILGIVFSICLWKNID